MHAYLIGICGTAMGSLAIALRAEGWKVSGSDRAYYPPMADALAEADIVTKPGWNPHNLGSDVDLVVVGNVCRSDNPEVIAAKERGLVCTSLPAIVAKQFVRDRTCIAVCGTHGKSTTTSLLAWMLEDGGHAPGYLIAARARNFTRSMRRGSPEAVFVIEADEYDTAYFEKTPKFWHYGAKHALWTSVEYDHVDIYPSEASYRAAYSGLLDRLPSDGVIVAYAGDAAIRELLESATQRVIWYAVEGDPVGAVNPTWTAAPSAHLAAAVTPNPLAFAPSRPQAAQAFDLFTAGSYCGRFTSPLMGTHNLRNVLGSFAMATEVCGLSMRSAVESLSRFAGLDRRQQLLGSTGEIDFYDDFAHHPTAVEETLRGFRARYPKRRLVAVFEPRSATACRAVHQDAYLNALAIADRVLLAPVGREEVGSPLDTKRLALELSQHHHVAAEASNSYENLKLLIRNDLRPGDIVVFMSNGAFGNVRQSVLKAAERSHR